MACMPHPPRKIRACHATLWPDFRWNLTSLFFVPRSGFLLLTGKTNREERDGEREREREENVRESWESRNKKESRVGERQRQRETRRMK